VHRHEFGQGVVVSEAFRWPYVRRSAKMALTKNKKNQAERLTPRIQRKDSRSPALLKRNSHVQSNESRRAVFVDPITRAVVGTITVDDA
jgi:hypothetical protein